ncbi:MAG TPA: hypothetical protein VJS43_08440 [Candidatus Acidoferrales bacterium]|nr:hypothetical protein [Candidatus Acidoferrales bacterium]
MILLGKIALGMMGAAVASAGLLCSEGFVDVNVVQHRDSPPHIHVIVPAMLAPIAVRLVPDEKLARASEQIQPWLPTVREALDGLRDAPDMTLVEVSDPDEYVHVAKYGGDIVVDVADRGETVHVSAPIGAIYSTVEALAAVAPMSNNRSSL